MGRIDTPIQTLVVGYFVQFLKRVAKLGEILQRTGRYSRVCEEMFVREKIGGLQGGGFLLLDESEIRLLVGLQAVN